LPRVWSRVVTPDLSAISANISANRLRFKFYRPYIGHHGLSKDLVSNMTIAWPFVLLPVWLAVSQGLRPLRRLSEQIAAREPEDISPVGIDPRHAELKPLIRSLDDLLAKLRHKIESERAFVANAAHELRTPLAVITAQAHVLAKATTEAERVDAERRLDEAIARSSHLIHQLLALARMEMERPAEPVTLDLAQLAHFAPVAFAHNIEISLEAPDRLMLRWEVHSIQSVVQNLIDNAIRYGRDGGRIVVEIQPLIGAIRLSVTDDGPGPGVAATAANERLFIGVLASPREGVIQKICGMRRSHICSSRRMKRHPVIVRVKTGPQRPARPRLLFSTWMAPFLRVIRPPLGCVCCSCLHGCAVLRPR
jgi:signal transduction histidine kinase